MKQVDYIIVGSGIAGISFCEKLEVGSRSFVMFDSGKQSATCVAGGVVNPIVLKRLNPVWKALEFIKKARPFYEVLQEKLGAKFLYDQPLQRIFASAEEQNDWMVASDSPAMEPFLEPDIIRNTNTYIKAPFGFGAVRDTFRIDTLVLVRAYREHLQSKGQLVAEEFIYEDLERSEELYRYQNYSAKYVIFTEGSAVVKNPYFTLDCLIPKKGEYLLMRSPELQCHVTLKGSYFIIPTQNDIYQVGATFAHGDFSYEKTREGRTTLEDAFKRNLSSPYEIVDQIGGMRPTVKDRRPLLGSIDDSGIYFLNGFGTRGLLMAPLLSDWLYEHIANGIELPSEVNVRRFLD